MVKSQSKWTGGGFTCLSHMISTVRSEYIIVSSLCKFIKVTYTPQPNLYARTKAYKNKTSQLWLSKKVTKNISSRETYKHTSTWELWKARRGCYFRNWMRTTEWICSMTLSSRCLVIQVHNMEELKNMMSKVGSDF
jgi:hypothetical protein